jgi:hypothetical protein
VAVAGTDRTWPGGFYTYTAIERLLGADIVNLDRIDPSLQTLEPGDQIWMTPERYLGRLPGQFGAYARCNQGGHSCWNENRRRAPSVPSGRWCCSQQPAARPDCWIGTAVNRVQGQPDRCQMHSGCLAPS